MRLLAVIKLLVTLHLFGFGAFCIIRGMGSNIPLVKYSGFEAHNIPTGIALCLIGLAVTKFWKINVKSTITEKHETTALDGTSTKVTRTRKTEASFMPEVSSEKHVELRDTNKTTKPD